MESTFQNVISPWREMLSWETLWAIRNATQKSITEMFAVLHARLPSLALESARQQELFDFQEVENVIASYLEGRVSSGMSVCVDGAHHYPEGLRDASHRIALFYYRGDPSLLESPRVSIVGARECSSDGATRAKRLARELSQLGYTIVSGLAKGIDTAAMKATIDVGGLTIGVIGTPLDQVYPKENAGLQSFIAEQNLLISHVPFYRYSQDHWRSRRYYFPQRNEVMASLSSATIIVEASETSGTHTQARECLKQGRKLFILNSCFESGLTWPAAYEKRGAIRVRSTDDILSALEVADHGGDEALESV